LQVVERHRESVGADAENAFRSRSNPQPPNAIRPTVQ